MARTPARPGARAAAEGRGPRGLRSRSRTPTTWSCRTRLSPDVPGREDTLRVNGRAWIVRDAEILNRLVAIYVFSGKGAGGEKATGETALTHELPAAPAAVDFAGGVISWAAGDDLGTCASSAELDALVAAGVLPVHPENVEVAAWEVVLEPDVDAGDPTGKLTPTVRVPGDIATKAVTVPAEHLAALPDDTPVKVEVGAIGADDNATFTEADGFCVNVIAGCED